MPDQWMDAAAAAERLGVKPATLYSYVSRGVLRRRPAADGRRSLFDAAEVEELARRGRPRRPPAPSEIVVESEITLLGLDRQYYRGHDATALAGTTGFEAVAELLWGGAGQPPWHARPGAVAAAVAAQSALPPGTLPLDRLQVIVATLAATDPVRFLLDPGAVRSTARALIPAMVAALPSAAGTSAVAAADGAGLAGALWGRLCAAAPGELAGVLDAALVLLADHELAASTMAARVAASVRADPYAVVSAGLGVLSGPVHGGASLGVERMLAEVATPADVPRVIGDLLRRGEYVPGAGHQVYRQGDARATRLLALLAAAAPGHPRLLAAEGLMAELAARGLPRPNVDLALGALCAVAGMVPGSGAAIFAVARTAGWLAHAIEEYPRRSPFRPRAIYTGLSLETT